MASLICLCCSHRWKRDIMCLSPINERVLILLLPSKNMCIITTPKSNKSCWSWII
jgi:hypothetical protein